MRKTISQHRIVRKGVSPMATEDNSSQSSNQKEKFLTKLSGDKYKVIVEFDDAGHSKISGEFPPRKTLWDWLQLLGVLAIPLVVAGATIFFGIQQANLAQQQHDNDQKISQQQY